jgi:hypothetical protein
MEGLFELAGFDDDMGRADELHHFERRPWFCRLSAFKNQNLLNDDFNDAANLLVFHKQRMSGGSA